MCKAPPRQKVPGRPKKARIRHKIRPTKPHYCSICGSSKHKRQSCAHRRDTEEPERRPEEEPEEDFSSDSDMDEVERARIETEAQRVQRIVDAAEMEARNEDAEEERQAVEGVENGEKLLRLEANISSDSEQGGETQL